MKILIKFYHILNMGILHIIKNLMIFMKKIKFIFLVIDAKILILMNIQQILLFQKVQKIESQKKY